MDPNLRDSIIRLKGYFTDKSKVKEIKNICFNEEGILKLKKNLKEKKKELSNFKFKCHESSETHYNTIKEVIIDCRNRVDTLLKKYKIEKAIDNSYFKEEVCCNIYKEIENNLRYIKNNVKIIEDNFDIEEDIDAEIFEYRFIYAGFKNLSFEIAKYKREEALKVTNKITKDIDEAFKSFQDEKKKKEEKYTNDKKIMQDRISELEDSVFEITKNATGNSVYYNLKLEVHNLKYDLQIAISENKLKNKTKKIIGGILIGVGLLALCLSAPTVAAKLGLTALGLTKGTVLTAVGISGVSGTGILISDYLDGKNNKEQIENCENSIKDNMEFTIIKKSKEIDEEMKIMKELIIELEEVNENYIKDKVNLNDETINIKISKFSNALNQFENIINNK